MRNYKEAFTLIELLVVIAIIAILAAILFPVFAQAKAAAKKASELSQIKQVGTATAIYLADNSDYFPIAYGADGQGMWPGYLVPVPADWEPGVTPGEIAWAANQWANSTMPYIKNGDMLRSSVGKNRDVAGAPYLTATKPFYVTNYQMNGLLNAFNATGVAAPSQLILFSQNRGNMNIRGYATSNPSLYCPGTSSCTYVPSRVGCATGDGAGSEMLVSTAYSQWVHSRGQVVTFADTSAKYRSMNGAIGGRSDFRTMYWTRFNADGSSGTEWQDTNFCHTLLFMPDFDFTNFGVPVEY